MKKFGLPLFLLAILICSPVNAQQFYVWSGFSTLPLGAGGYLRGGDIQCDQGVGQCNNTGTSTRLARADTYGCYLWNGTTWQQLITKAALPVANFGYYPTTGTSQVNQLHNNNGSQSGGGCYEVASAPSNTNVIYAVFNGLIFVSTNHGGTFVSASGTGWPTPALSTEGNQSANGRFMAIDPANPDIVIIGFYSGGLYYTTNGRSGASATWTQISSGSVPTAGTDGYRIAFDPATISGGSTSNIYVYSSGAVYATTGGVADRGR